MRTSRTRSRPIPRISESPQGTDGSDSSSVHGMETYLCVYFAT